MKRTTDDLKLQPGSDVLRHSSGSTSGRGFTIVEVLIVLAIAGLIMLIVFEAIPSLTRASRNGRRKQDIGVILDAVSNYELKNSDNFPQNCSGTAATACNASDPSPGYINDYFLRYVQSDLSYYTYSASATTTNPVTLTAESQGNAALQPITTSSPAPTEQVEVYDYEKCDSNGDGGANSTGADYNDVVALYALEGSNSGSPVAQCQQL